MSIDERFPAPAELKHRPTHASKAQTRAPAWKTAIKVGAGVFVCSALLMLVPTIGTYLGAMKISFDTKQTLTGPSVANAASQIASPIGESRRTESVGAKGPKIPTTHSESEAMLFDAVVALRAGQLGRAEATVERLLEKYPNYQLAHLLRADILQARRGKLTRIGEGAPATEQLEGLLKELEARVGKFSEPAIDGRRPDMFIQLAADARFALAVDVSRSRLYVLENAPMGPRRVFDVYATIGKSGGGKAKEGDKRTPIGVYTLQSAVDRSKLTDFYGEGAFPLDYPNALDKKAGRDGHGIWLHGVSKDNFVRPPQSSDGCIVVSNADLKLLTPFIEAGKTSIAIADSIRWIPAAQVSEHELSLRKSIEQWRSDWESRVHDRYMTHYAEKFFSDKIDGRNAWSETRKQFTEKKSSVAVSIENLAIASVPNESNTMMVMFDQRYKSDAAAETTLRKRQYWQREGTRWKILYEGNV
jgi:murein L,D-transpeptidase YafK